MDNKSNDGCLHLIILFLLMIALTCNNNKEITSDKTTVKDSTITDTTKEKGKTMSFQKNHRE